jgi:hypothetical protein
LNRHFMSLGSDMDPVYKKASLRALRARRRGINDTYDQRVSSLPGLITSDYYPFGVSRWLRLP